MVSPNFPAGVLRRMVNSLPEEERAAARVIMNSLESLQRYVDNFQDALNLFDFSSQKKAMLRDLQRQRPLTGEEDRSLELVRRWPFVAARDGAMTIFHFGMTCDGVRASIKKCPTLIGLIDYTVARAAIKNVWKMFPGFAEMRHSVAHAGEKSATPEQLKAHALVNGYQSPMVSIAPGSQTSITDMLEGRMFSNTWNGKVVTYEISADTLNRLHEAKETVWKSFLPMPTVTQPSPVVPQP